MKENDLVTEGIKTNVIEDYFTRLLKIAVKSVSQTYNLMTTKLN